mmetsp:Transcript_25671/g.59732  ORF Transcript_25671/g.59732 Transcript_25671/m.59732 type:complete len:307 (-) Transcript_25671:89-1009(-)
MRWRQLVARGAFSVLIGASMVAPWLLAVSGSLVGKCMPRRSKQRFEEKLAHALIALLIVEWRCLFRLCVWIQIEVEGFDTMNARFGAGGRPVVLVFNHLSFLDSLLMVPMASLTTCHTARTMVAGYILNIPVAGTVMRAAGCLTVPFKGGANDFHNLEVEKEQMDESICVLEGHLRRGGVGIWFPEGVMNRGDPHVLQKFRAGAFAIPARLDVQIWCGALVGTNLCWPVKTHVGGFPARIGLKVVRLTESSRALLDESGLPEGCTEREKAVYLAGRAQQAVQAELDVLVARGFSGHVHEAPKPKGE